MDTTERLSLSLSYIYIFFHIYIFFFSDSFLLKVSTSLELLSFRVLGVLRRLKMFNSLLLLLGSV